MADEKTEEEKVEDTNALDSVIADGDETEAAEKEEVVADAMKKFDDKLNSDDDDSAGEDDGEEEAAKEEVPAKEEAAEETVVEDSMEAAADAIEAEIEAESKKTDEQKATEAAAADAKAAAEAEAAEAEKEQPYDCGLVTESDDEEVTVYEPKLVEAMNKQGQQMQDRAKAAESENAKLYAEIGLAKAERNADWLDTKVEKLGESYEGTLGKGEFIDLEPGGDQQANRMKIWNRMAATSQAYAKQGKEVPTRSKLFEMAVKKLHKIETKKSNTGKETVGKLKARAEQVLGSGSKKGSALSVAQRNKQKQREFDKKFCS